jgi:hypothetical protein
MTTNKQMTLVILLMTTFTTLIIAQKAPIRFGKIDDADLKMKVYAKDSAASAVILCDYGEARMDVQTSVNLAKYSIVYTFHRRVKVFKADPSVLEDFGNIEIPYRRYDAKLQEVINNLKASIYEVSNGKIIKETKLDKSGIFDKEEFKNYFTKKFALPNIKDGCIIEYTYEIKSDLFYQPRTWYFQSTYPTKWSEYRFDFLEYYIYAYNQEGYNKLTIKEKGTSALTMNVLVVDKNVDDSRRSASFAGLPSTGSDNAGTVNQTLKVTTNRWAMADVPALRNEAFITTPVDYFDKIEFQLNSIKPYGNSGRLSDISFSDSWEKFIRDQIKSGTTGKRLRQHGAIKDIVTSLTKDKTTAMDKVAAISNYIKTNISTQNGFFLADDRSNDDVISKKTGTVGDINLLFGAMLSEAGLKVTPILMSTRSHGRVAKTYPLESRFNYLLMSVNVDGNDVLLDATNAALPTTVLPFQVLNGEGLFMDVDKPRWVDLQGTKMADLTNADITIENGKILRGVISTTQKSYKGWDSRLKIAKDGADKHAKVLLEKLVGNGKLVSQKFENTTNSNDPLKGKFEFETSEFMDVNAERIYLNPMLSFGKSENLLKKPERLFPVDFAHPSEEIYNFSLKVPAGYTVEELPKPVKLQWEDGSVGFQYIVAPANTEGVVKITSKITIKKPVFSVDEYADLKKTFDQIVAKHAEQIVLKKTK